MTDRVHKREIPPSYSIVPSVTLTKEDPVVPFSPDVIPDSTIIEEAKLKVNIVPLFFAFDHINYARWATVHLRDLLMLEHSHP